MPKLASVFGTVIAIGSCQQSTVDSTDPSHIVQGDLSVQNGHLQILDDMSPASAPAIDWQAFRGAWYTGIDTAVPGGPRDLVLAAKKDWPATGMINDVVYVSHNGDTAPTVGIGVTPPSTSDRVQLSAQDDDPKMGTLLLRRTPKQTANLLTTIDSAGTPRWWLDSNFWIQGASLATGASVSIKADAVNGRPLVLAKADGSAPYGFQYKTSSDTMLLRYFTTGVDLLALNADGRPGFPSGLTTSGLRLEAPLPPQTSTSPCTRGEIVYDVDYVYICVATNSWKRSALASW